MNKEIYIIELNKLESFLILKGLKHGTNSTPSETAEKFCKEFCRSYNAEFDKDSIVIYLENGFVSYSDLDYLDDSDGEYDEFEIFDLRYVKKNNAILY